MTPEQKPSRRKVATIAAAIGSLITMLVEALAVSEPILQAIFG